MFEGDERGAFFLSVDAFPCQGGQTMGDTVSVIYLCVKIGSVLCFGVMLGAAAQPPRRSFSGSYFGGAGNCRISASATLARHSLCLGVSFALHVAIISVLYPTCAGFVLVCSCCSCLCDCALISRANPKGLGPAAVLSKRIRPVVHRNNVPVSLMFATHRLKRMGASGTFCGSKSCGPVIFI